MIACDSSIIIAWLARETTREAEQVSELLRTRRGALAPVTVTEVLSGRPANNETARNLSAFSILDLKPGYWERTGSLRQRVRAAGRKAALGDALIVQACLDHDLPLLARDRDFRAFAELAGLKLA